MAERSTLPAHLGALMSKGAWEGARLTELPSAALLLVRARGEAATRVARALGIEAMPAPTECRPTSHGDCLWLRPDEWLVIAAPANAAALLTALDAQVLDDGAVIDLCGARTILELVGRDTRDVLASCCPLDLHPRAFAPGRCAQTLIGKVSVLLQLVDGTPRWRLFANPSYVDYVVRWLADGMEGARADGTVQQR